MSDKKKGFFSFLGIGSTKTSFSEEEEKQRHYAIQKAKEEEKEASEFKFRRSQKPKNNNQERRSEPEVEITQEIIDYATVQLQALLDHATFSGKVAFSKKDGAKLYLDIQDVEDLGRIIGKQGSTLNALQTLIRAFIFQKYKAPVRVIIEAGDYRKKKVDQIKEEAEKIAEEVLQTGEKRKLRPMNAAERRSIHLMFENHKEIKTASIGRGDRRQIILEKR